MATRAVSTTIEFRAWDTSANAPKTGDNANFTLSWIKDGTRAAPTNASSEVDSANAPGIYKITLTATETDCVCGTFAGKSSTANVALFGPEICFDYVPTAATTYGAFIGNATAALAVDASGRVDVGKWLGQAVTLDANNAPNVSAKYWAGTLIVATSIPVGTAAGAAGGLFFAGANAATTMATFTVTGAMSINGTGNVAQTGDSFARIGVAGVGLTNLGDARIAHLDVDVSSRSTYAGADTAGTTTLLARVTGAVMLAASYTAPDNASIAAVKTQTDKLTFTTANVLDCGIYYVNGVKINGVGSAGTPFGP